MGIRQICETIGNLFSNVRPPFPQLPRTLLVCSMIKRPGLSVIRSVTNITKDLNKLGIPTGPMPDGSMNLTVGFIFANTKEMQRAIKKDMVVQASLAPGSSTIVAQGANGGGPVTVAGTIVNFPPIVGTGKEFLSNKCYEKGCRFYKTLQCRDKYQGDGLY
jgi:hypothetical protein